MRRKLDAVLTNVKVVGREYSATRLATDRLLAAVCDDPTLLSGDVSPSDIRRASENLEGTYLIRLFAEFETVLRLYWSAVRGTPPPSRTRDVLDGIAATRRIPVTRLFDAHAVREYRNTLVHERDEAAVSISMGDARRYLCRFLSFLPPTW